MEPQAAQEIAVLVAPLDGKDVLEITLEDAQAVTEAAASAVAGAKSITRVVWSMECEDAAFADVHDRFDLVLFSRVLTFATEQQAKWLARKVLQWLRPEGVVTCRESCLQAPFPNPSTSARTPSYREPSFYIGLLGTTVADDQTRGFAYLDFVHCKSLDVYRKAAAHTHGELVFTYKKVDQPAEEEEINTRGRSASQEIDTFQNFLDYQQYSNASITRYEKIFGSGYVSTGGQVTTTEFVARLDLKPGQRVLDVGCGIGGGDFYMANTFGVSVHGIDLSTNMVTRAIEQFSTQHVPHDGNDVQFEICDATSAAFASGSFDVIYSRDTILHIEDKRALFTKFFQWLKPGGKVLISDYCCGDDKPPSDRFKAYVKKRGYVLFSPRQYGQLLENVGFTSVVAEDRTDQFVAVLQDELARTYEQKTPFIQDTSEADFNDIIQGWEAKLTRCADGDQKWGLFLATKP